VRSQVDDGEHADPDDVERVPEQAEAEQAPQTIGRKPSVPTCAIITSSQQQAEASRAAVRADQREERGQERAARRAGAVGDHAGELGELEARNAAPSTKVTTAHR
jgi:hypothetical protein